MSIAKYFEFDNDFTTSLWRNFENVQLNEQLFGFEAFQIITFSCPNLLNEMNTQITGDEAKNKKTEIDMLFCMLSTKMNEYNWNVYGQI